MTIGIYFTAKKSRGGVYQYSLNILDGFKSNQTDKFIILNFSPDLPLADYNFSNWEIINFLEDKPGRNYFSFLEKINHKYAAALSYKIKSFFINKKLLMMVKTNRIDLIFFPGTINYALTKRIPFVAAIHDIQHRLNSRFPELADKWIFKKRELAYKTITKKAYKVLVDSIIGQEDIVKAYGAPADRIVVLPYLPPAYFKNNCSGEQKLKLKERYHLPNKFLFYPAQFWPHKNHKNLIEALKILKDKKLLANLILVGAKKEEWGEFNKILDLISRYNLQNQVSYLGYVSNEEINLLYQLATALIMPTYLGPTNIPVVEAWQTGCPVLYSDIRGCREQAGGAALLFNPDRPSDIAEKIETLWQDEKLQKILIEKGQSRLMNWTQEDFNQALNQIINNFKNAYEK